MRQNSAEFRQWLRHRNLKNLRHRTKKKGKKRKSKATQIEYNHNLKRINEYNTNTGQFKFSAPTVFSFVSNAGEVSSFFHHLLTFLLDSRNEGKKIFIDIANVRELSIDALMYLLAIVEDMNKNVQRRFRLSGNIPKDDIIRKRFEESGFYNFVRYSGPVSVSVNEDRIQIVSGNNSDTALAKQISDFVCKKAGIKKYQCGFLYNMIIELMSNTHKHAYNTFSPLSARWYCFVECVGDSDLHFTFMDTGEGIPATVRKTVLEKLDVLSLKEENKYVISALQGEYRTSTNKSFRGKGLPKIREFCRIKKIQGMRIITNKADVTVTPNNIFAQDIETPILGTLFYWKIDASTLRKESSIA